MKQTAQVARIRSATWRRAKEQAKRIPWPSLAKAADQYTEWQVFALWVRATADGSHSIPAEVQFEIERRAPAAFRTLQAKVKSAITLRARPGTVVWEEVICWAEMNVFLAAKRGRWLDPLRYFSAMSLHSMKAWSCWEQVEVEWRSSPPRQLPTLPEWRRMVASVTRFSNAESAAQHAFDVMRDFRKSDWDTLLTNFIHLTAFCQWVELMMDAQKTVSHPLSRELFNRHPGFSLPRCGMAPKEAARCLQNWVLKYEFPAARPARVLAALRFWLRHHAEYAAVRNYAAFCRMAWVDTPQKRFPTFEEWKNAADSYSEAD